VGATAKMSDALGCALSTVWRVRYCLDWGCEYSCIAHAIAVLNSPCVDCVWLEALQLLGICEQLPDHVWALWKCERNAAQTAIPLSDVRTNAKARHHLSRQLPAVQTAQTQDPELHRQSQASSTSSIPLFGRRVDVREKPSSARPQLIRVTQRRHPPRLHPLHLTSCRAGGGKRWR